jgi:soluble lytic murein transglycosylase
MGLLTGYKTLEHAEIRMAKKFWRFTLMILGCLWMFILEIPLGLVQAGNDLKKYSDGIFSHSSIRSVIEGQAQENADAIALAIMTESRRFDFDPLIVMSVIQTESGFAATKRGRHGEIGLMQIKPSTARWIAAKTGLPWKGSKTLENPEVNIRMGTAYLVFLKKIFLQKDFILHHRLYLAAYNMGAYNVRKAIKKKIVPTEYASRVFDHYQKFHASLSSVHLEREAEAAAMARPI